MPVKENQVSCNFLACEQALHLDERCEPHKREFKREAIVEKRIILRCQETAQLPLP